MPLKLLKLVKKYYLLIDHLLLYFDLTKKKNYVKTKKSIIKS